MSCNNYVCEVQPGRQDSNVADIGTKKTWTASISRTESKWNWPSWLVLAKTFASLFLFPNPPPLTFLDRVSPWTSAADIWEDPPHQLGLPSDCLSLEAQSFGHPARGIDKWKLKTMRGGSPSPSQFFYLSSLKAFNLGGPTFIFFCAGSPLTSWRTIGKVSQKP